MGDSPDGWGTVREGQMDLVVCVGMMEIARVCLSTRSLPGAELCASIGPAEARRHCRISRTRLAMSGKAGSLVHS